MTAFTNVSISFTYDEPSTNGEPVLHYKLEFCRVEPPSCQALETTRRAWALPADQASLGDDGAAAATLIEPGQTYTLRVKANNAKGDSATWSPQASTPTADRPDRPLDLSKGTVPAGLSSSTTLLLEWIPPESHGHPIDGYELLLDGAVTAHAGTDTHAIFGSLEPGSQHNGTLRAHNAYGWSEWANIRNFDTIATAPDQPDPLTYEILYSTRQITLLWSKPGDNGLSLVAYQLESPDSDLLHGSASDTLGGAANLSPLRYGCDVYPDVSGLDTPSRPRPKGPSPSSAALVVTPRSCW